MTMEDKTLERYEGSAEIYKVPSGTKIIADNAFYDRGTLRKVILPNDVDSIGDYAFKLCYKLKNIKLPESVEHFGFGVFQQCHRLESVNLPNGIKVIDAGMFVSCTSLRELGIPDTVESIEPGALAHCVNLDAIYTTSNVFELVPDNKKLITAITYIDQIHYMTGKIRQEYIDKGAPVYSYIKANIKDIILSILERKQEYLISDMLGYLDFKGDEYSVILDELMDAGREDLTPAVLESRLNSNSSADNNIFDFNPFS